MAVGVVLVSIDTLLVVSATIEPTLELLRRELTCNSELASGKVCNVKLKEFISSDELGTDVAADRSLSVGRVVLASSPAFEILLVVAMGWSLLADRVVFASLLAIDVLSVVIVDSILSADEVALASSLAIEELINGALDISWSAGRVELASPLATVELVASVDEEVELCSPAFSPGLGLEMFCPKQYFI